METEVERTNTDLKRMAGIFARFTPDPASENPPIEALCLICDRFITSHPDVVRICNARDPSGLLLTSTGCTCHNKLDKDKVDNSLRWGQANLPHKDEERTFDNFKAEDGTGPMVKAAWDVLADEGPNVLTMVGVPGCGKSHLAEAAAREWLRKGKSARFELTLSIINRAKATNNPDNKVDSNALLDWYNRFDLLVLDDLGKDPESHAIASDFERGVLHFLVESRLASKRRLIVTTNFRAGPMEEQYGDRLTSRLYSTNPALGEVNLLSCRAKDYRRA